MRTLVRYPSRRPRRAARTVACRAVAGCLTAALAGCGSSSGGAASPSVTGSSTAAAATSATAAGLSLKDSWVKAAPTGMTAIFGTLDNPTGQDSTLVSATSPVAGMVQLHEVVTVNGSAKMQPKAGGFVVPAHGTHELKPGGDHIMLMDLKEAVKAGDTVTATLTLKDGSTVAISAIGKDFTAGNETYAPSGAATPSAGRSSGRSTSPSTGATP